MSARSPRGDTPRKAMLYVHVTPYQLAQLRALSAEHERSVADLIREGIDEVLRDFGIPVEPDDAPSRRTRMPTRTSGHGAHSCGVRP